MCALSPLFPVCEWPLDDSSGSYNQISNGFADSESIDDFHHFTLPNLPQIHIDPSLLPTGDTGDDENNTFVKKLNHNASERDRRQKMNNLYSCLRSLLPPSEQKKRLSIPNTISRMLKYIPDLQAQVEVLLQKKEQILSSISMQDREIIHQRNKTKTLEGLKASPFTISVTETEVVIQITSFGVSSQTQPLSAILFALEDDALCLTDAYCFRSFGGTVFYSLHFQVERSSNLESVVVVLNEKLLSLCGETKASLHF